MLSRSYFVGSIMLWLAYFMGLVIFSMPALAAAFYPTQGRGTGVAWMLGIGRFGGIAGSFLVAELTRRQFTFGGNFAVVAIAGVISSIALLVKQAMHPQSAISNAGKTEFSGHSCPGQNAFLFKDSW